MNTKNIKTAVIVMLVLANIFFAGNVYLLNDRTKKIPQQMIENAVAILNRDGLEVKKEAIPDDTVQNYIYECVYVADSFESIAKSLAETEKIQEFPAPNEGTTYIAGEGEYKFDFNSEYFAVSVVELPYFESLEPDKVRIYEDTADMEYKINGIISAGIESHKKSDIKKAEDIVKKFLKKYQNQSGYISFDTLGYEKNKDGEYIVINQKFDGLQMNSHIVFVEINNKKVRTFVGKWYFGTFVGRYKLPLLDSVNILFKCLEKDSSIFAGSNSTGVPDKLEKMQLHYNIVWHESSKFYLSPSWTLFFSTGKTLTYDAIAGSRTN